MRIFSLALLGMLCASTAVANDRHVLSANLGLQIQNDSSLRIFSDDELDWPIYPDLVGNAEIGYTLFGDTVLYAGVSFNQVANVRDGIYLGLELLNYQQHGLNVQLEGIGYDTVSGFNTTYSLNYVFAHQDWRINSSYLHTYSPDIDRNPWVVDAGVSRSIYLPKLGNSELIVSLGGQYFSTDTTQYWYGNLASYSADFHADKDELIFNHGTWHANASVDWLYPLSENWLLNASLKQNFSERSVLDSPVTDESKLTHAAVGVRYVF